VVDANARRSGGGDGPPQRRLGGQAERREEPPHGVGLGHRAEDLPRVAAAWTNQDLEREHPAQEPGPRPPSWRPRAHSGTNLSSRGCGAKRCQKAGHKSAIYRTLNLAVFPDSNGFLCDGSRGLSEESIYRSTFRSSSTSSAPFAFAKVYTSKMPVTGCDLLYDRVLPFYSRARRLRVGESPLPTESRGDDDEAIETGAVRRRLPAQSRRCAFNADIEMFGPFLAMSLYF
jgi:hypothetical protein